MTNIFFHLFVVVKFDFHTNQWELLQQHQNPKQHFYKDIHVKIF